MLSPQQKQQIKSEEIYREEVRKQLQSRWSFLNSPFFLWFLSAVVIGLISFFYSDYTQSEKDKKETNRKIEQLDIEIENRISQFWFNLEPSINKSTSPQKSLISFKTPFTIDSIRFYWKAFKNEPSKNAQLSSELYDEFENRSTPSLMFELSSMLEKKLEINASEFLNEEGRLKQPLSAKDSTKLAEVLKVKNAAIFISRDGLFDPYIIKEFTDVVSHEPYPIGLWSVFEKRIIRGRWDVYFNYRNALWDYSNYDPGL